MGGAWTWGPGRGGGATTCCSSSVTSTSTSPLTSWPPAVSTRSLVRDFLQPKLHETFTRELFFLTSCNIYTTEGFSSLIHNTACSYWSYNKHLHCFFQTSYCIYMFYFCHTVSAICCIELIQGAVNRCLQLLWLLRLMSYWKWNGVASFLFKFGKQNCTCWLQWPQSTNTTHTMKINKHIHFTWLVEAKSEKQKKKKHRTLKKSSTTAAPTPPAVWLSTDTRFSVTPAACTPSQQPRRAAAPHQSSLHSFHWTASVRVRENTRQMSPPFWEKSGCEETSLT